MGYIYCADVYCDECGDKIRERVKADGKAPEDWMDHSSYDSDEFPKDADVENDESDSPEHCGGCGKFLQNPLTSDGYTYVKEKLDETGESKFMALGMSAPVLNKWAHYYNFTYWDQVDCDNYFQDERKRVPGWYSNEAF